MDLLEKASIILTPTAYNNGEALCVKPTDGSGDFDFSRNSAATRVNAQGLVENVQILSSNLVQNGDFSELGAEEVSNGSFSQEGVELVINGDFENGSTGWNVGSGWLIQNGFADIDTDLGTSALTQNVLTSGKWYKMSYDVNITEGEIKFYGQSYIGDVVSNTSSTSESFIFKASQSNIQFRRNVVPTRGSIDNVSVKEVGQDWDFGGDWELVNGTAEILTSTNSFLVQSNVVDLSVKNYKLQYEVITTNGSNFRLAGGNSAFGTITLDSATIGVKTIYLTSNGTARNLQFNQNAFRGSIDNISVKEVDPNDYWYLDSNWSIGDNKAISTGSGRMFQPIPALENNIGTKVKVSFEITERTSGGVKVDCYGAASDVITEIGTHTFIGTTTNSLNLYVNNAGQGNLVGSVTNFSVIEITDDTNLPRISYENFSYQDALGSEEVVNGGFNTNLNNWVAYSNTLISWESEGYALLNSNGGYWCKIQQANVFEIGKTYKVILTAKSNRTDLSFHNSPITGSFSQADTFETFEQYYTATTTTFLFGYANAGSATITIDNVSVKEVLGQEVVPDSGCGSWLFEPQSTNLVTDSQNYNSTYWGGQRGVLSDGGVGLFYLSPNSNVIKYEVNQTQYNQMYCRLPSNVTIGNTYTQQGYVKCDDAPYIHFQISPLSGNPTIVWDNVNNTVISSDPSIDSYNITSLNDGWVKAEITYTASVSNIYASLKTYFSTSSTTNWAGVPIGTIAYQTFVQVEELPYATSYIPTEGTQKTRNQDVCNNGGSLASINSTEGVLYFEGSYLSSIIGNIISLSNGGNTDVVYFRTDTINRFKFFVGSNSYLTSFNDYDVTENHKIALLWSANSFKVFIDGQKKHDVSISFNPSVNYDRINFANPTSGGSFTYGKTKALAVWKEALSDEELTELTTI